MPDNTLIVGATSRIAIAFAREMGKRGGALHLIARDTEELKRLASDLHYRFNIPVTWSQLDADRPERYKQAFEESVNALGTISGVLFATGTLGDQWQAEQDADAAAVIAETNYISGVRFLTLSAQYLEKRAAGFIAVITSVAGDRGRPSNYVYGSSKGALALFAQGLRSRLCKHGVHVLTVKPGFVDTKMTFGKSGMFLVSDPEDVARSITKAINARKEIVYVPSFWALIMSIIRIIPEPIFKRLNL